MKRLVFLISAVCLCAVSLCTSEADSGGSLVLLHGRDSFPVGPHVEVLTDPGGRFTVEDVSGPPLSARFRPLKAPVPNFGFRSSTHWLRFKVVNRDWTRRKWVLELQSPTIDHVDLFVPAGGHRFRKKSAGDAVPFHDWEIDYAVPSFQLDIPPGVPVTYFLRLRSSGLIRAPLFLRTPEAFAENARVEQARSGIFFGAAAVIILYGLLAWLAIRDRAYFHYLVSTAGLTMTIAIFSGWAYQYLWPDWPRWNTWSLMLFAGIAGFSLTGFVRNFLKSEEYAPSLDRVALIIMAASALVCPLSFLAHRTSILLMLGVAVAWCVLTPILALTIYIRGYRPALGFLIAYLLLLIGLFTWSIALAGMIPYQGLPSHPIRFGILGTWILISLVLIDRYRRLRLDYEASLERTVTERTAQLNDALAELRESRDLLEERVEERTAELRSANVRLEQEIEERVRAEALLEEAHFELEERAKACFASEERFRTIFESARDYIYLLDTGLRLDRANPALLSLLGKTEESLKGMSSAEVFGEAYAKAMDPLERRALHGETIRTEQRFDWKGWPLSLDIAIFPMSLQPGAPTGICCIARDVTGRDGPDDRPDLPRKEYASPAMRQAMETIELAAASDATVLFLGESGSGKDYWARRLHELSPRSSGSFWSINCAVLPSELVESELFGHEAGAFTGAAARKRGLLELAEGGTLLLNEIGELPLSVQSKLLGFLDDHSFTRIGGERTVTVDARIVAATNRDLEEFVKAGKFREDLFYRINVLAINIPPLRERREDLPALVSETLQSLAKSMGLPEPPVLDPAAGRLLLEYRWPGNIRELRNVLERAIILSRGESISCGHLGLDAPPRPDAASDSADCLTAQLSVTSGRSMRDAIDAARKSLITEALERCGGNVSAAARLLGIPRDTLRGQMRKLGLS